MGFDGFFRYSYAHISLGQTLKDKDKGEHMDAVNGQIIDPSRRLMDGRGFIKTNVQNISEIRKRAGRFDNQTLLKNTFRTLLRPDRNAETTTTTRIEEEAEAEAEEEEEETGVAIS
uniref:Uncharacterized protein n=1 Tax=Vespula pensylvanica TaxID=30213 RepID=A0A834N6H1_VESPE|nr:hypothetical protein H0235_016020 [Vespula pensylvanica]